MLKLDRNLVSRDVRQSSQTQ